MYFNGQPLATWSIDRLTGTYYWADSIYANGQRIATVKSGQSVAHLSGSNVPGSGSVSSGIVLSSANGITIQQGDSVDLWQFTADEN